MSTPPMDLDRWGIADGWTATDGRWQHTDPATSAALAAAQGAADHPDGPPQGRPVWFVTAGDEAVLHDPCELTGRDGVPLGVLDALPADLGLGCYDLAPVDGGPVTSLFVVPARAPRPPRCWGWSAQLYATRSQRSWGMGDFGDLAKLAEWSAATGAEFLAHNPLGASLPLSYQQPSPYYPSSRRYWSPLYLDVPAVPGVELADQILVDQAGDAAAELNRLPLIDRDEVWRIKASVLESIWKSLDDSASVRDQVEGALGDADLRAFATFCALAEHFDCGWSHWPDTLHHPDSPAVAAFALAHAERVRFHAWLQIECDRQLGIAAAAGSHLMGDLPVGFDPDGFDAWVDQDLLALDCSIGAPPDDLGPLGQNWGLPPYVPWKLRNAGYEPWIRTLERLIEHCSALRIDHVMGLFRLFWIPDGLDADHGGYVYQHGAELLDLALMVAAQHGAVVVGEDLGTVEPAVRDALEQRGVFGYRVAWFDRDPGSWPATTLASLATHDLPTVAGLWDGTDTADRKAAGLDPAPDADADLRSRLRDLAGVDDRASVDVVLREAHRALAGSASDLAVVGLDDAVGARRRPNIPGTVDEHPNWRLALPVTIEDLGHTSATEIAAAMNLERASSRLDRNHNRNSEDSCSEHDGEHDGERDSELDGAK